MKLFNRTKKEEQNNSETKKENKVLKFVRNHAIALAGGAIMIVTIAAIAAANSDDDAFATVAYSDGDIGFVGKDYIMNLAERIAELRNEEEES